jgi:hypothetical protein
LFCLFAAVQVRSLCFQKAMETTIAHILGSGQQQLLPGIDSRHTQLLKFSWFQHEKSKRFGNLKVALVVQVSRQQQKLASN